MNSADWIIVAIVAGSALISLVRGFVREALSLLAWVVAFAMAMLFHPALAGLLTDAIETPSLRLITAWLAIFLAVLLAMGLVNFLLSRLVRASGLSGTDRFLGSLFGAARGLVVVLALLIAIPQLVPVTRDSWWQESTLIPVFLGFEGTARELAGELADWVRRLTG
ncbi:MAG: CvpA family protein [Pseudomonadota bacterium]|jgi:membrane protein required for colicin V production